MRCNDLIPLRDVAEGQCEEALLRDEQLGDGAVVRDEGGDDAEGATGLSEVGLRRIRLLANGWQSMRE
jgi:hypothetical protein